MGPIWWLLVSSGFSWNPQGFSCQLSPPSHCTHTDRERHMWDITPTWWNIGKWLRFKEHWHEHQQQLGKCDDHNVKRLKTMKPCLIKYASPNSGYQTSYYAVGNTSKTTHAVRDEAVNMCSFLFCWGKQLGIKLPTTWYHSKNISKWWTTCKNSSSPYVNCQVIQTWWIAKWRDFFTWSTWFRRFRNPVKHLGCLKPRK